MKKLTMPRQHARCGMRRFDKISTLSNKLCGREVRP
ncbi:hypothetical protein FHT70_000547 [Rhizobium sp. BK049]|nr:hypothetical protein [Rhizobium sp. BK049]